MEISKAIEERRSIRKFTEQPVEKEIIKEIVRAGALAPSASNLQAWRFFVADDPALVRKIDLYCPGLSGKPPVILAIGTDLKEVEERGSKNSLVYGCMMDASMAGENMILKAMEYGLGTCAIKSYNDTAVKKLLKIPESVRLELLISLGYPSGDARERKRKDLDAILYWNAWEER